MNAYELDNIRADIRMAELVYDPEEFGRSPNIINMVAYHSAQAIEKCLKSIIRDNDTNGNLDWLNHTHNISSLLIKAELHQNGIINNHNYIAEHAEAITHLNTIRYGDERVTTQDAFATFKAAKALYNEARLELEKAYSIAYPDLSHKEIVAKMNEDANKQYATKDVIPYEQKPAPQSNASRQAPPRNAGQHKNVQQKGSPCKVNKRPAHSKVGHEMD